MLIQKRASYKKWGDKWDISVGGCVSAGETSDVAAMREVKEEIGLDIDLKDKRCNFTFTFEDGFDDIYLVNVDDIDLSTLKLQQTEVSEVKWMTEEEILKMNETGEFIPYQESYLKLLFEFRNAVDMYGE
jgi:isopentenyldiphosphate isomerase